MFRGLIIGVLMAISLPLATSILTPAEVSAARASSCSVENSGFLGMPTWYKFLEPTFSNNECVLQFLERDENGLLNALPRILLAVFEIILRIGGLAAVGFVIFGGIQYILSQGEPDRTKASKNTIINALIGLVVAIMSTAIVNLVGSSIT